MATASDAGVAAGPAPAASNPRLARPLLLFTWVEVAVVLAAAGLYYWPDLVRDYWPWLLSPFNAFFIGAIYSAAWLPLVAFALSGRWSPGRVALPMIGVFTAVILAVSLAYLDRFLFERWGTWIWFVLYVSLPVNSAIYLWRFRHWPPAAGAASVTGWRRLALAVTALLGGGYGTLMLVAPVWSTQWWPWPIDAFHGRMYAAAFLTLATGAAVSMSRATMVEIRTAGLTALGFGAFPIAGLAFTDAAEDRVDWAAAGTVSWLTVMALMALIGLALLLRPAGRSRVGAVLESGQVGA